MAKRRQGRNGFSEDDYRKAANAFLSLDGRSQLMLLAVVLVGLLVAGIIYYATHRPEAPQQATTWPSAPATPPTTSVPRQTPTVPPVPTAAGDFKLLLGNPSNAIANPANRNNYLMVKPQYVLSYNNDNGTPNWVSWRVTLSDLGSAPRKPIFDPDSSLPPGFKVIVPHDYTGSGFDRGHMCPHADRGATEEMSFATFTMTNIIPQAANVNQKAWGDEEEFIRSMVKRGNRMYIIAGPVGKGGVGLSGPKDTIASGRVTVPAACWKIAVVVPAARSDDDLAKINASTRVITIIMPNDNDKVGPKWGAYRVSVAEVERQTGYHFFDRLPADISAALKSKVDTGPVY